MCEQCPFLRLRFEAAWPIESVLRNQLICSRQRLRVPVERKNTAKQNRASAREGARARSAVEDLEEEDELESEASHSNYVEIFAEAILQEELVRRQCDQRVPANIHEPVSPVQEQVAGIRESIKVRCLLTPHISALSRLAYPL